MKLSWSDLTTYLFIEKKLDTSCESSYKSRFKEISLFFQDKELTRENVNKFFYYLIHTRYLKNNTLNNYLKLLKHIEKYLKLDILGGYSYWHKDRATPVDLKPEVIRQLAEVSIPRSKFTSTPQEEINYRYRVMIYVLSLGLRVNELCSLTHEDVLPDRLIIREENTKTNSTRLVPLKGTGIYDMIQALSKVNEYVFGTRYGKLRDETVNEEIRLRCEFLKLPVVTAHNFRYAYVTNSLRAGIPIEKVQLVVGHKSLETTASYRKFNLEDYEDAVSNYPLFLENKIQTDEYNDINKEVLKILHRLVDVYKLNSKVKMLIEETGSSLVFKLNKVYDLQE